MPSDANLLAEPGMKFLCYIRRDARPDCDPVIPAALEPPSRQIAHDEGRYLARQKIMRNIDSSDTSRKKFSFTDT